MNNFKKKPRIKLDSDFKKDQQRPYVLMYRSNQVYLV